MKKDWSCYEDLRLFFKHILFPSVLDWYIWIARGLYFRTVYTKQLLSHLLPGQFKLEELYFDVVLASPNVLILFTFETLLHFMTCIRNVSKNGDQIRHSFESSKTLKNEWKQTHLFNKRKETREKRWIKTKLSFVYLSYHFEVNS